MNAIAVANAVANAAKHVDGGPEPVVLAVVAANAGVHAGGGQQSRLSGGIQTTQSGASLSLIDDSDEKYYCC